MVSASCSYYSSTYGSSPHEFVPRDGRRGIAIVASTLLIAGLVQPVRGFLLRSVDRRFHRAKYGAEKTLTAFRAGLLHEVRLCDLQLYLIEAVRGTMQPTHLSLWLARPTLEPAHERSAGLQAGVTKEAPR